MCIRDSAREAERGIVDIETLQQTNQMLIDTMDEVLTIQQEGRQKRQAAEGQLKVIENDLRNKLLEPVSYTHLIAPPRLPHALGGRFPRLPEKAR